MKKQKPVLAINGGTPVLRKKLPEIHNVGKEELDAVTRVLTSGPLSGFIGTWSKGFFGGKEVLALEKEFAKQYKVKHAVSFNSATTGLHAAVVALGIGPGDEVIVPPYSMAASATAVIANGAVPIFADIDPDTYCLDPKDVEKKITKRTKALMVVNLFGQAADYGKLIPLARKNQIKIIEDNAQSPGALWKGKYVGTVGDIGVFSLNIHKTVQTGEGGILVTNNDTYALRAQLSRNHGESVVDGMPEYHAGPIFGSNYRMSEVIAAMARVQIRRLSFLTKKRVALAKKLTKALEKIDGITVPKTHKDNTHVYYRYAMKIDEQKLGLTREKLSDAMRAEGFLMTKGYVKPMYLLPLFQEKKAFNQTSFPFNYDGMNPIYAKGICPVAEHYYDHELMLTDICQHPYTAEHVDLFVTALKKVLAYKDELK